MKAMLDLKILLITATFNVKFSIVSTGMVAQHWWMSSFFRGVKEFNRPCHKVTSPDNGG